MRSLWAWSLLVALASVPGNAPVTSTRALVAAMQRQYGSSWYHTATFEQKTTTIGADGRSTVATWYEALEVPGRLRIDFAPVGDGNGLLFANGQMYSFKAGKLASSRAYIHPLLLLGFDIYKLPVDEVMKELKGLNFDVSKFHEDTWEGRQVYIVGADPGDQHTAQFWVDREHLYFIQMIRPTGPNGVQTQEVEFNKYERLGGGWMAPEVISRTDAHVTTTEEYSDLRVNVPLEAKLFDPAYFSSVHWKAPDRS